MKKGFTLIELLAVIIIVAIISLVAIPVISNVVNNTKVSALKASANGLLEASNLYRAQYGNSKTIRFDIEDNKITSNDTDKLLSYNGDIKSGTIIIDNKGRIVVCVTDGKNSAYKNYNEKDITTNNEKACNIKEGSSIVYLGNEATLSELSNQELTDQLTVLQAEVKQLKNGMDNKADKDTVETIGTIANSSTLDKAWPIGSIYMTMTESTVEDVHNKLGGTWEKIESGRMLQSTSSTSGTKGGQSSVSYTPSGSVGGHVLTEAEMPKHSGHVYQWDGNFAGAYINSSNTTVFYIAGTSGRGWNIQYGNEVFPNSVDKGSSQAHNHPFTGTSSTIATMPPYITVYMYKRIS